MHFIKRFIACANILRFIYILLLPTYRYKDIIYEDVKVALEHRKYKTAPIILGLLYLLTFDKYFRNLFYYRIGKFSYMVKFLAPPHSCFTIGTYTPIGKGFLCVHPFSTIINARRIGNYFTVRNDVTIGESNGIPTIGDNVTVNVHSVIIGNITIGDNVIIGAGTLVCKDIPNDCVVVGNPAYIIKRKGVPKKELL